MARQGGCTRGRQLSGGGGTPPAAARARKRRPRAAPIRHRRACRRGEDAFLRGTPPFTHGAAVGRGALVAAHTGARHPVRHRRSCCSTSAARVAARLRVIAASATSHRHHRRTGRKRRPRPPDAAGAAVGRGRRGRRVETAARARAGRRRAARRRASPTPGLHGSARDGRHVSDAAQQPARARTGAAARRSSASATASARARAPPPPSRLPRRGQDEDPLHARRRRDAPTLGSPCRRSSAARRAPRR